MEDYIDGSQVLIGTDMFLIAGDAQYIFIVKQFIYVLLLSCRGQNVESADSWLVYVSWHSWH